ncbi:MAG: cytochrome c oxidase subunit II, partial [Chloroflexi bacterium]|nr:cytochrome c oxidase subunit II [Chloroflexota bacterium]
HLDSVDVNHSFWVPKLAGKLDVIPGRTNDLKFNATSPGTFSGLCAEYCGIGHPDMKFKVIALEEPEFQAWCEEQLALEPGAPVCQR